jgi:hypothetical protein
MRWWDTLLTAALIVGIVLGGSFWWESVREHDTKLAEIAACASAVDPAHGDEYRAAWNACWEAHDGTD